MLGGSPKTPLSWPLLLGTVSLLACSSAPPPVRTIAPSVEPARAETAASASTAAVPPDPAAPEPAESFAQALLVLRPSGTEHALQALSAAPTDPEAYAQAALAYAATDVPGMTLLWGLTYQAMGGGSSDAAVASALSQVLTERILADQSEGQKVTLHLRLAPGDMPVRQAADGTAEAPLAHVFEASFGPAVTGFRPPWTIEQFYDVLSTWTGAVATHGSALDEQMEVGGWLVTLARAGHLEGFCHQLLGSAFPAELKAYKTKSAAALKAYREFVKGAKLRPKRAPLPDDLVRIK